MGRRRSFEELPADLRIERLARDLMRPVEWAMSHRLRQIVEYIVSLVPARCPHCGGEIEFSPRKRPNQSSEGSNG